MTRLPQVASSSLSLRVAQVVPSTEAEGPGRRFAIWVQGCALHCPGCCNPEMFDFEAGSEIPVEEMAARILATPDIEGVSYLGGEPSSQAAALAALSRLVRAAGRSVMVFSGHTLAELEAQAKPEIKELLSLADILVDGRYERAQPETRRRWIGSKNQVMHFLTDRYHPADPVFRSSNSVEIRLVNGEIIVNGWPAVAAKLLPKSAVSSSREPR